MRNKKMIMLTGFLLFIGLAIFVQSSAADTFIQKIEQIKSDEIHQRLGETLKGSVTVSNIEQINSDEIYLKWGETLKDNVTVSNSENIVAIVNGENISLNEWNYNKISDTGRAKNFGEAVPSDQQILDTLIKNKVIVSTAKQQGLYPNEEEINSYISEQRQIMAKEQPQDVYNLIKGWGISEEEFFSIMKDIWGDSIARLNWYEALGKNSPQKENETTGDYRIRLEEIYNDEVTGLVESSNIEITNQGILLGLSYSK